MEPLTPGVLQSICLKRCGRVPKWAISKQLQKMIDQRAKEMKGGYCKVCQMKCTKK